MQRLGKILHANERGLVARVERVPRLGTKVLGRDHQIIGKVSDVFGPTSFPYVAIRPASNLKSGKISELAGEEVYIGGKSHGVGKKK